MSVVFGVTEAVLVLLGAAAAVVAIVGIGFSKDAFAQLIFGSIAGGGALIAIVAGLAIEQGATIVTLQGAFLVLLMVPSSAIAAHRIAALVLDRSASEPEAGDETTG